jgi:hypothetical protein
MSWQVALVIFVSVNIVSVVLTGRISKKITKVADRAVGVFYQYLFCFILAIGYALLFEKGVILRPAILTIGLIGVLNCIGNYFQWEAQGLSESKTPLFFPLFDVGDVILAMIFLGETRLWNNRLIAGAILCLLALYLFKIGAKNKGEEKLGLKWLFFILILVVVTAWDGFLVKVFASSYPLSKSTFLIGWYGGSFAGAFPLLWLKGQKLTKIPIRTAGRISIVSLSVLSAICLLFWTYQLGGTISQVLPIRAMAITIVPCLLGLFVFGEKKGLTKKEWLGFAIGIAGGILVASTLG